MVGLAIDVMVKVDTGREDGSILALGLNGQSPTKKENIDKRQVSQGRGSDLLSVNIQVSPKSNIT